MSLIDEVRERGAAVCAYDPAAVHESAPFRGARPRLCFAGSSAEAAQGTGALAIVTERKEFRSLNMHLVHHTMRQALRFDGGNMFDPAQARLAGFEYSGIGRS